MIVFLICFLTVTDVLKSSYYSFFYLEIQLKEIDVSFPAAAFKRLEFKVLCSILSTAATGE